MTDETEPEATKQMKEMGDKIAAILKAYKHLGLGTEQRLQMLFVIAESMLKAEGETPLEIGNRFISEGNEIRNRSAS